MHHKQLSLVFIMNRTAERRAVLVLFFLVAVDRIKQEMREVIDQRQLVADGIGACREPAAARGGKILPREIGTLRHPLVARIEFAEAADEAPANGAPWLIGLVHPQTVIKGRGQRVTVMQVP